MEIILLINKMHKMIFVLSFFRLDRSSIYMISDHLNIEKQCKTKDISILESFMIL